MSESEVDKNRQVASLQREVALQTKKLSIDEMSHAWRWVMASVLTVNSGGLIAAVATAEIDRPWSLAAIFLFYLGVFFSLLIGWRQVSLIGRMLPIHSEAIAFWESASIEGDINDISKLEEIRDKLLAAGKTKVTSGGLGKLAFFLFSAGLLCLAASHVLDAKKAAQIETTIGK
ncbi:hypothetical protein [Aurantiacibacter xanthus]|uniref:hypothetical protein n=1 Tax=Aurantiacibacter xanthus TaxID=1784712 RepID=UPI0011C217AB|nr:hypothetical protein [Aurantiacibacter xanthus]